MGALREPAPAEAAPTTEATEAGVADAADAASHDASDAPAMKLAPELTLEKPFVAWARPRPKGDVAAGAHDELVARWNLGGTSSPEYPSSRPGFHPGTRVKVDTRVVAGRLPKTAPVDRRTGKPAVVLSETSLLARARKHGYWRYRLCFERVAQEVGKVEGGETVLRFAVDPRGRIGTPQVLRTKLKAAEVVACLAAKTPEIELLPPSRRLTVELAVQVWPGDAPLPSLPPPPSDPALNLPVDSDAVTAALEQERGAFERCYSEGLGRDPALWGRLQAHVELGPAGGVSRARETESRFPDPEVSRCVLGRIRAWRIAPRAGHARSFEVALRLGREPERPAAATP